jgi:RecB family exonuclease
MGRATQLNLLDARPRRPRARASGRRLAVLPDAARVEERLLQRAAADGPVAGRVACTMAELESEIVRAAQRAGKAERIAPPLAVRLLLREIARERTERGSPFHAIRSEPGFVAALADLLSVLEQGLLPPGELLALAPALPEAQRDRIAALAGILRAAQSALARRGLALQPAALRSAVRALQGGLPLPPLLAEVGEITFEWVLDWTPLRVELACALAGRLERDGARVHVKLPFASSLPDLSEAVDPALRAFEAAGAAGAAPEVNLTEPEAEGPLAPFLQRLFAARGEQTPQAARDSPVLLRSCASPAAQAREVARRCGDLLRDGAAPDAIAIAVRSLSGGTAEELGAALDRAGLPWRERRGRPALPSPPIQLALQLFELAERDFPREDLAAVLGSRLLWMRAPEDRLPAHEIARWLRAAHVRDDASNGGVSARLTMLAARLRARAEAQEAAKAGPHGQEPEELSRSAARVDEVRRRAQRLIDSVRGLPRDATLRDHGSALLALLARWELPRRLRAAAESPADAAGDSSPGRSEPDSGPTEPPRALVRAAAAALARDQAALDALEQACADLAAAARALGRESAHFSRAEYAQLLRSALSEASLRPGGARGAAIHLVELREMPGRSFDHVLIAGLLDGELPARPAVDPLLSEEERRAINRAARRAVFRAAPEGDSLLLPPRQSEELLFFHLGLSSARCSAALFWARADARGRDTLRSPFVDEALRALGAGEDAVSRAALAPIPLPAECGTAGELLARAVLDAFAEPAWRATPPLPDEEVRALAAEIAASPLAARFAWAGRAALAARERLRAFVGDTAPGRFSGQLGGAALQAARGQLAYGREGPLSSHQLEEYATCAFKTLGHRLVGIQEEDEGEDDLATRERGTLLHRCLDAYFRRMQREARLPLRGGAARDAELATLREVSEAEMEAFARTEHVGHRGLWDLRRRELHATLAALIDSESGLDGRPVEFERKFGFAADDSWEPLSLPAPEGDAELLVRGAIDRIDKTQEGGFVVLDYKSSRSYRLRRKLREDALLSPEFQLPLYAAVLARRNPGARVDAQYVSIGDARRTTSLREAMERAGVDVDALIETDPGKRTLLRARVPPPPNLADEVWRRVGDMREGRFPVRSLSCDFCDLKPLCRIVALPSEDDESGRG